MSISVTWTKSPDKYPSTYESQNWRHQRDHNAIPDNSTGNRAIKYSGDCYRNRTVIRRWFDHPIIARNVTPSLDRYEKNPNR